ncbi:hypothetical protein M406DRAFT_356543 [Cryphonectria parasitica EP155]|uniref:NADPH-dependent FMN reductase-like domain-containing protein n=1 Tax=Cryphonectria parasitica (strain ATCC 38755 / EP155) TaxID=660469 RepID=A0A9P4XZW6_CRYP1|nr:uncharacterized protein M406DRAFT_356543 [Cryphonectria parasitica EP155]KAF3764424.1 hypothetical protein M406DRAFT_356543 [Cryphonectria parasitica EP155]
MDSTKKSFKVGIICGSTRSVRVGPQVTAFVRDTISHHLSSQAGKGTKAPPVSLEIIDIENFNLPLFDEIVIPQAVTEPSGYAHEHTRAWSACVSSYHAFVFVTPQYNWGIPASLKNAVDYLYNEWKGKPAMVVSYGGHGGGRAAEALRTVCQGLKMGVVEKTVNMSFPDRDFGGKCYVGGDLGLAEEGSKVWEKEKEDILAVWDEMANKLTGLA